LKLDFKPVTTGDILNLRHKVLRKGKPLSSAHFEGDDENSTFHFGCTLEDQIIGCVSLMKRPHIKFSIDNCYQLRGMAVDEGYRGLKIGKQLLDYAESNIEAENIKLIWCNVRTSAETFYAKSNYQKVGRVFDIPNVGPHVLMFKKL
jgi:ribosomal protein S18 acetylase RimI-like enzyme